MQRGFLLLQVVVFSAIAITLTIAFMGWATASLKVASLLISQEQAFQIAEAGVDYYRWHLAHADSDFEDATGGPGPYVHPFFDKDGKLIGEFSLSITPPPLGSTLVVIESTGRTVTEPVATKKITTHLAIPSWAKFALVSNADTRFIPGAEFFGPVHSNGGVRFDALAHNLVTSAKESYEDGSHNGPVEEFGVHTHVKAPPESGLYNNVVQEEQFPNDVEERPDVFMAGREFPVPAVDFVGITSDLSSLKTDAQAHGLYLAPSGALGYHIVLKTDDTFDVFTVNSLAAVPHSSCKNTNNQTGWGTWSINSSGGQTLLANYPNPTNGVVFVEDDVWVDGGIDSARITIAAAKFPDNVSTRKNIIVNHGISYTNYDGTDVIGLIAQNNVLVGLYADDSLSIDAALIAQNGTVFRYHYPESKSSNKPGCSPYDTRTLFESFGMLGVNTQGNLGGTGNGYATKIYTYDANLLYSPPPSFPKTSDKYSTVFWQQSQ